MAHGSTAGRHRLAVVPAIVLVVVAVLLGGCSGTEAAPPEKKVPVQAPQPPVPTMGSLADGPQYTVEQLAAKLGCTAKFRGPTKGFRQAACAKDGEEIVLLDFASERDQFLWLDRAIGWGGIYLVGNRWGVSGVSKEWMASLGKTIGGSVQDRSTWRS